MNSEYFSIKIVVNDIFFLISDIIQNIDPCNPSPCGPNAICSNNGVCSCLPEYHGDPYFSCRPECVLSSDCAPTQACARNKCVDPCRDMCGLNAECQVYNHVAVCSCPSGMSGNAFYECFNIKSKYGQSDIQLRIIIT